MQKLGSKDTLILSYMPN